MRRELVTARTGGGSPRGGRAVRVSILVQGGEADVERLLSEVVRALAGERGREDAQAPGPASTRSGGLVPECGAEHGPLPAPEPAFEVQPEVPALGELTKREVEVLDQVACGYDNSTIADHLGISRRTVRNHLNSIFSKLDVAYRPQAVVLAREAGLGRGQRGGFSAAPAHGG